MISIIMYKVSKYYSTVPHTGLKVIHSFITTYSFSKYLSNAYHVPDIVRYITVNNMTKCFPFSECSIRDETQTSKQAIAM